MPLAIALTQANQAADAAVSIGRSRPLRRSNPAAQAYTAARYVEFSASTHHGGGFTSISISDKKTPRATSGAQRAPRASKSAIAAPVLGFQGVMLVCGRGSR